MPFLTRYKVLVKLHELSQIHQLEYKQSYYLKSISIFFSLTYSSFSIIPSIIMNMRPVVYFFFDQIKIYYLSLLLFTINFRLALNALLFMLELFSLSIMIYLRIPPLYLLIFQILKLFLFFQLLLPFDLIVLCYYIELGHCLFGEMGLNVYDFYDFKNFCIALQCFANFQYCLKHLLLFIPFVLLLLYFVTFLFVTTIYNYYLFYY
jgi:hypothetical protein